MNLRKIEIELGYRACYVLFTLCGVDFYLILHEQVKLFQYCVQEYMILSIFVEHVISLFFFLKG
jgi:hypothetical protein